MRVTVTATDRDAVLGQLKVRIFENVFTYVDHRHTTEDLRSVPHIQRFHFKYLRSMLVRNDPLNDSLHWYCNWSAFGTPPPPAVMRLYQIISNERLHWQHQTTCVPGQLTSMDIEVRNGRENAVIQEENLLQNVRDEVNFVMKDLDHRRFCMSHSVSAARIMAEVEEEGFKADAGGYEAGYLEKQEIFDLS